MMHIARLALFASYCMFSGVVLCAAFAPAARAGFELTLDAGSVRQIGDYYAIDVLLTETDPSINLRGMIAGITSTRPGLTFLDIEVPENSIFAPYVQADSDGPLVGDDGVVWGAYISLAPGNAPIAAQDGLAFQLNFSVAGGSEYELQFVEANDDGYLTSYSVDVEGKPENSYMAPFGALSSATFTIAATPEPSSMVLLATAMSGFGLWRWRRRPATPSAGESLAE